MSQLKNLAAAIITAPELLVFLIVLALYFYHPSIFITAGGKLTSDSESWKFLTTLPFAFTTLSFKSAKKLRSPSDKDLNKILYEWKFYSFLVARINFALFISLLCSLAVIITWLFGKGIDQSLVGAIFVETCLVSATVTIILIFASWKLPEMLIKYGT